MTRTAKELNLPSGDAVLRDGMVTILPHGHDLDRRATDIGPTPMPQSITTQSVHKTSAADRATGFHISTSRLSWAFVVAGVLIAVWGYQAPIWSMVTLFWAFAAYVAAWVVGWIVYQLVSPDGAALLQVILGYKLIRFDQKARIKRQKERRDAKH